MSTSKRSTTPTRATAPRNGGKKRVSCSLVLSYDWLKDLRFMFLTTTPLAILEVRDPFRYEQVQAFLRRLTKTLKLTLIELRGGQVFRITPKDISSRDPRQSQSENITNSVARGVQAPLPSLLLSSVISRYQELKAPDTSYVLVVMYLRPGEVEGNSVLPINPILYDLLGRRPKDLRVLVVLPDSSAILDEIRRASYVISETPMSEGERTASLENTLKKLGVNSDLGTLVRASAGLMPSEFKLIVETSFAKVLNRETSTPVEKLIARERAILLARSLGVELETPKFDLSFVGGYEPVKRILYEEICLPLMEREEYEALGISRPSELMLLGPPGTGKTLTARALAGQLGLPIIVVRREKFFGPLVGETERRLARLLQIAEELGCLLFFDEAEQFGMKREWAGRSTPVEVAVTSMLNEYLTREDRKAIVIMAVNKPEVLEEAFLDRFPSRVPLLYPDAESRFDILKVQLYKFHRIDRAKFRVDLKDSELRKLAEQLELWSGRDIYYLVRRAIFRAVRLAREDKNFEFNVEFLSRVAQEFHIDIQERVRVIRQYLERAEMYCTYGEILSYYRRLYSRYLGGEGAEVTPAFEELES